LTRVKSSKLFKITAAFRQQIVVLHLPL